MSDIDDPNKTNTTTRQQETDTWLEFYNKFDERHPSSRSKWYDQTTEDYRFGRPRYPDSLVDRVCRIAKLHNNNDNTINTTTATSTNAKRILEIGCGPGTATLSFCQRGMKMVAIDPSPSNCAAAKEECQDYILKDQLEVIESTFEDWNIPSSSSSSFDAVLCATSYHWIPSNIRLSKISQILKERQQQRQQQNQEGTGGTLILLWAFPPHPSSSINEYLQQTVYEPLNVKYLGELPFHSSEKMIDTCEKFHSEINESGYFNSPAVDNIHIETLQSMYSISKYLSLLCSLSPYIALDPELRITIIKAIQKQLVEKLGSPDKEFEVTHWYGSQVSYLKKEDLG